MTANNSILSKHEEVIVRLVILLNLLPEVYNQGFRLLHRNLEEIIENGIIGFSKRPILEKLTSVDESQLAEQLKKDVLNTYFEKGKFEDGLKIRLNELKRWNIFKSSALREILSSDELTEYIGKRDRDQYFVGRKFCYWLDIALATTRLSWNTTRTVFDELVELIDFSRQTPDFDLLAMFEEISDRVCPDYNYIKGLIKNELKKGKNHEMPTL